MNTDNCKMSRDIDTGRVIEEVQLRKCLWNASDQLYRNKDARLKAWSNIVVALFEDVQENEIKYLEKHIHQRWKTARDAFFRYKASIKNTPPGSAAKMIKKYTFYDELSFLNPTDDNIATESLQVINDNNSSTVNNTKDDTPNISTMENSQSTQSEQEQRATDATAYKKSPNPKPAKVLAVVMDVQNMYHRPNSSSINDTILNEAQGGYRNRTQPTYKEEYVPQMYHRPNSSSTNETMVNEVNEAQGGYCTQTTYEEI